MHILHVINGHPLANTQLTADQQPASNATSQTITQSILEQHPAHAQLPTALWPST